jgi:hypothetical protein
VTRPEHGKHWLDRQCFPCSRDMSK